MHSLKPIIAHVPHAPGVYRFLDGAGEVLYVGKAIDLKKRVSSYFSGSRDVSLRLKKLVEKIADIQYTVVASELEALILETNLIKSFRPRYNILMKDDKSYVYLKITVQEPLPRIVLTRRVESDGAIYFGPKTSMNDLRRILDVLKKIFPYRHCPLFIQFKESLIDVADHRKRCFGVCVADADPVEYRQAIDQIAAFFRGRTEELEASLKVQMESAVAGRHFEQAALLRDRLAAVREITETQRVSAPDHANRDVLGLAIEGGSAFVTLLIFREGKLIDQQGFVLSGVDVESGSTADPGRVLSAFLEQYYERATDLPHEILLPHALDHAELLESWLHSTINRRIRLLTPERGKNRELLELAASNAASFAKQSQVKWLLHSGQDPTQALTELQALLGLPRLPRRIEGYDISHLGGTDTVGSMVVFEGGLPKTSDYRHFKLRSVQEKIDDYQAMGEVLARRLRYLQKRPANFRKPKKRELPALAKILKKERLDCENLDVHSMLVVELKKKIVGMGRLKPLGDGSDKTLTELASLWVSSKHRGEGLGQQLVRWLLEKQKKGKVYAIPNPEFVDWYGALGFHVTSTEIPLNLVQKLNPVVMVYRFMKEGGDSSFSKKPDLIVVDGGRGQLNVALTALKSVSLTIPMVGLAKQEEDIYTPNSSEPLRLPRETPALQLLMRLRDEAHRFALTYQRDLREKRMLR